MTTSTIGPVPASERITVIDCLRGAALFGILTANMRGFAMPATVYFQPDTMWTSLPDRIVQAAIDWLVTGKFVTIFAGLFGLGFAILMERAAARGSGTWFYVRRMTALLVIGILHAFLLWWGDILISYALCGYLLLFFRNRGQKTVLVWAHVMYWFVLLPFAGFYVATLLGVAPPAPQPEPGRIQEAIRIYATGTYPEIFAVRAREWLEINAFVLFLTRVLGMFLFGLYIWREGYLRDPALHLGWWERVQRVSLPIGLIGNAVPVIVLWIWDVNPMRPSLPTLAVFVIQSVAIPALSLFYVSTVVLLYQDPVWQRRLLPFSYVGRMALTNYLLQSIVCTTLFYSYGLGLYGKVGPLLALPLTLVVYALQVPFSKWWLSRHRYGPVEWVWRRLTYGVSWKGEELQLR
jgi:uncharacterized protein